jgi:flavin reductase (DIM6/NTAB) family NADH-FMN oxidoreductase RutF
MTSALQPAQTPPLLLSKRQEKKQRKSSGVSGLHAVPCGMRPSSEDSNIIAVDGTVAHLQCSVYSMMKEAHVIDDEHYLVFGEVTRAFVHGSYWDSAKSLFRPDDDSPPYLTFFGSQTFGYIVTK